MTSRPLEASMRNKSSHARLRLAVAAAISLGSFGCHRVSPAWNGTWKLKPSESRDPFPNFWLTVTPSGEHQFDNGTYTNTYGCDGKGYPLQSGITMFCVQKGPLAFELTAKSGGGVVTTSLWALSVDGKTLTADATAVRPSGSVRTRHNVYARVTGSSGFTGAWQDVRSLETRPQVLVLVLTEDGHRLHYALPERGQYADPTLDGTDAAWYGPGVPPGGTIAVKPNGPREFSTLRKFKGQITNQGIMRVSVDGRTLVEAFWSSERPDQKALLVYERR